MSRDLAADWALVVAHPGHELHLLGRLMGRRAVVHVVASGSRSGDSLDRLEASRALLMSLGCVPGSTFGEILDRELYQSVMTGDAGLLDDLVKRLRDDFVRQRPALVVSDAWQLYNCAHDLTHLATCLAVAEAELIAGRSIPHLTYDVVADSRLIMTQPAVEVRALTDAQVAFKLSVASRIPDLKADVDREIELRGLASLATEPLFMPLEPDVMLSRPNAPPLYEVFGRQRVAAGLYQSVLTWAHVEAVGHEMLARSLKRRAAQEPRASVRAGERLAVRSYSGT